jgi:DNA recombination protein RmuC
VAGLRQDRAHQHGEVVAGLQQTLRASSEVATTARSLREALSSSRARGQWGERMADDVLRLAGFTEGISYHRQRATADGTVPDFSFPLPGGLALHMDVKFPLDNYLRYLDGREDQARTQFLRDVRARVRELGGRGYIRPGETVDYVLLFIPNEAVYGFVHEQDPALADFALGQRVVLCSPFTLFAVLAVVRQATDSFALQRSTDDILRTLGRFAAQWEKFSEQLEVLGRRLDLTQRAYEDLAGTRRRQLQRMVDAVDELRRTRGIDALPEVEADAVAAGAPEPVPLRRDLNDAEEMPRPGASIRDLARRLTG